MVDFNSFKTTSKTCKLWVTPENEFVPLSTWHYQYFEDAAISQRYKVPYRDEISTRIAAVGVGFVRINYERNGGRLTIETCRWSPELRQLLELFVLNNADSIDFVFLKTLDTNGNQLSYNSVSFLELRKSGKEISATDLDPWRAISMTKI